MPFATPEEVRQSVRDVRAALGASGGLLLAPTHILEPEVPWGNVEAFVAAAKIGGRLTSGGSHGKPNR
jgi:uroporphyrinogen decarboxylase